MKRRSFFSKDETRIKSAPMCSGCGLYSQCNSPRMAGTGKGTIPVLFIAEAPGEEEDRRNTQLVGECGQKLREILWKSLGVNLDDCRKINAVNCRPPKNRTPKNQEIKACFPMILDEIRTFRPKVIIPMGNSAIDSIIGSITNEATDGIMVWRGFTIPDVRFNAWIVPTIHPSFVLRNEHNPVYELQLRMDLEKAFDMVDVPFRALDVKDSMLGIFKEEEGACHQLYSILDVSPKYLAFDYETTGLKPYNKGHRIVSVSFCCAEGHAFAFPFFRDSERFMSLFRQIMESREIGKVAHSMRFEDMWTKHYTGITIRNWKWDTQLTAHILDNRPKITGLKFQSFVRWGISGYENEVKRYLQAEYSNDFNQIDRIPINTLLKYNAMDSLLEYRLMLEQKEELYENT